MAPSQLTSCLVFTQRLNPSTALRLRHSPGHETPILRLRGHPRIVTRPLGEPISEILQGYPLRLREVHTSESYREHVGYALWFNGGYGFPLLQVLWPDKRGRFPDDTDADPATATLQPRIP
jgi:Domain of unknown function (DUF4262)